MNGDALSSRGLSSKTRVTGRSAERERGEASLKMGDRAFILETGRVHPTAEAFQKQENPVV